MSETPDLSLRGLNDCGCCAGLAARTPAAVINRAGLARIAYRVGTHTQFRQTMLAALSSKRHLRLQALTTRDDDDFTIALLDAWATLADVLTFYQERLVNESYLRTATEIGAILRLARLIGYELRPGVAASARLAFTLEDAPGSPEATTIDIGTKVQSIPGPGETAQTFETTEKLAARLEWTAMRPQTARPQTIAAGTKHLYLRGTATQLQPGDAILLVGDERDRDPPVPHDDERWDVRVVQNVTTNPKNDWTRVSWEDGLGKGSVRPAEKNLQVFAFRQRAALFGHNAPDPRVLTLPATAPLNETKTEWKGFVIAGGVIDLDASYPKIVPGSWLALVRPPADETDRAYTELYRAKQVSHPSRIDFGLAGKITRIRPDTVEHLSGDFFKLRETLVFAESERLPLVDEPVTSLPAGSPSAELPLEAGTLAPVEGRFITLDRAVTPLEKGRALVVSGKRMRARVSFRVAKLTLTSDTGAASKPVPPGETLVVLESPAVQPGSKVAWRLRAKDGFEGGVTAGLADLLLASAAADDEVVSEVAAVDAAEGTPATIALQGKGLRHSFDRATVTIAGNVAAATHGETVEEVAGNGDAGVGFQRFTLRQPPLTCLRSSAPGGVESTLAVRVDDILWHERRTLFGAGRDERVFIARQSDDGKTTIQFGDGALGARLPSGVQNVRLKYRKGSGLAGLVKAGQLSQLLTRPLGVRGVVNPLPGEGADDPESLADARENAPLTVLTLDRVVSLQDYEDFARSYPGVSKALATWTWDGRSRGVLLTVAGPNGATIAGDGDVATQLPGALRAAGDPFVPIRIEPYRPAFFTVAGTVKVDPDHLPDKVVAAVRQALRDAFSFAARRFGQPVVSSEIIATMQRTAGVVAVDLDRFQRTDRTEPDNPAVRLLADLPANGAAGGAGAELLVLRDGALEDVRVAP